MTKEQRALDAACKAAGLSWGDGNSEPHVKLYRGDEVVGGANSYAAATKLAQSYKREQQLAELRKAEAHYFALGDWPREDVDAAWIKAKSAAYNRADKLRAELFDLNDHRRMA